MEFDSPISGPIGSGIRLSPGSGCIHSGGRLRYEHSDLSCLRFSGIQRYVLAVKSEGRSQAKRLRARSFLLELYEHAALATIVDRLEATADDVLVSGGGGFLVRLPTETAPASLEELAAELQRKLWKETRGEVQVSMGWGCYAIGCPRTHGIPKAPTGVLNSAKTASRGTKTA